MAAPHITGVQDSKGVDQIVGMGKGVVFFDKRLNPGGVSPVMNHGDFVSQLRMFGDNPGFHGRAGDNNRGCSGPHLTIDPVPESADPMVLGEDVECDRNIRI